MIRKRLLSITLSLALALGSAAALPEGVISESASITASAEGDYLIPQLETNTSGAKSNNVSNNNYSTYGSTVNSYLYEDSDNYLWRAEYIESKIVIEMYSQGAKKLLKTYTVKPELPLYGGVFFGEDYNYVVSGQRNPDYDDNIEVLRVTKYTKQWEKVDHASVYGANTLEPFHAGSCRLAEASGKLYVDTCHLMYKSGDGLNHQANMCYVIDESQMLVIQSQYIVWDNSIGYVSHSFNQFITTDGENIYRIDHGDAYPRGIPIFVNSVSGSITNVDYTVPVTFEGAIGQNSTGASIGGLEVSSDTILFPYNQEPDSSSSFRNVLINVTSKDLGSSYQKNLTNYDGSSNVTCSTPQMVKVNNNMYVVMWEETDKTTSEKSVRLVCVDRYGDKASDISAIEANLSDCQPILCSDGCIRWYVTSGGSPLVYAIQPYDINSLHIHQANWKVTKEATCTTDGKKTGKCSVCGKTITQIIKATGHEWEMWPEVSWDGGDKATAIFRCCNNSSHTTSVKATIESTSIVTPATCSNTGIKSASIKVSFNGYTYTLGKTASIPKIAHKFSAWTTTKKASCTADGTQTRKCSVCGKTETKTIKATGHKFTSWTTTKKATCTADGIQTRKCSVCGKTETKSIAKLSHSYKATVVKPTCSAKGYTLHKCTKCGYSYKDTYTNTVAHKFSAWTTTKKATCTADGTQTRKCSVCGKTESRTIKAPGHKFTNWTTTKKVTCTTDGTQTRKCSVCGKTESRTIKAPGHKFTNWTTTKKATCTADGAQTRKCSACGKTESRTIKAPGHKFTNWTTTKKATCTANGTQTRKCSVCGKTETKPIAKLSHSYKTTVVKPTCTAKGYTLHKCTKCGASYKDKYTNTIAHKFSAWKTTKAATPVSAGTQTKTCSLCKKTQTRTLPKINLRLSGHNRYDTSISIANQFKKLNGNSKFKNVIIASGTGFSDALSSAYLAKVKDAPILIVAPGVEDKIVNYVKANTLSTATIYIIGGDAAVPKTVDAKLKQSFKNVKRLWGKNRFGTNLAVLKEAGTGEDHIIIGNGLGYADALSASATGKPILLTSGKGLTTAQKAYLKKVGYKAATLIGESDVVSKGVESDVRKLVRNTDRQGGRTRFETSVLIAKKFFKNPKSLSLAYGLNYPDGLCGAPLSMKYGCPLILASDAVTDPVKEYAKINGVTSAVIYGGSDILSDKAVKTILGK